MMENDAKWKVLGSSSFRHLFSHIFQLVKTKIMA